MVIDGQVLNQALDLAKSQHPIANNHWPHVGGQRRRNPPRMGRRDPKVWVIVLNQLMYCPKRIYFNCAGSANPAGRHLPKGETGDYV